MVGEVGDGAGRGKRGEAGGVLPEDFLEHQGPAPPYRARPAIRDHRMRLREGDEGDPLDVGCGDPLVEASGDLVVVEGGHEMRADPGFEQGTQGGLRGDDHASGADPLVREEVEVLLETRPRTHHHPEPAAGHPGEVTDPRPARVAAEVPQLVAHGADASHQLGGDGHPRPADRVGEPRGECLRPAREATGGGGMLEDPGAGDHLRLEIRPGGTKLPAIGLVADDPDPCGIQPTRAVDPREDRPEQSGVRFEHRHHAGSPQPLDHGLHVVAEPEAEDRGERGFGHVELVREPRGLATGLVHAGQAESVPEHPHQAAVLGGGELDVGRFGAADAVGHPRSGRTQGG